MSSVLMLIVGALCWAMTVHSCDVGPGLRDVCLPTVCSVSKCWAFQNSTCVDDKCGCAGVAADSALSRFLRKYPTWMTNIGTKDVPDEDEDIRQIGVNPGRIQEFPDGLSPNQVASKGLTNYFRLGRRPADEDLDGATDASLKLVKAHADVLQDMLSDEDYIPVGESGKPGVLSDRAFFSSLIQTVLPVVQNLLGF